MRYCLRLLIPVVLFFPFAAQSQQAKVSLDLGSVTVWLGMPRQELINKCAGAGFKQMFADDDGILFTDGKRNYNTQFKDGRLAYADLDWYSSKGELDAFQTTMAALASMVDSHRDLIPACAITHEPLNKPDYQVDRIFISCGKRSFLLLALSGGKKSYGIMESIGKMVPARVR